MKTEKTLLGVVHYPMSVMEIYLSPDTHTIYEVNSQPNYVGKPHHIWKEYAYPLNEYMERRNVVSIIGKKIEAIQKARTLIRSNGHEYAI